MAHNRTLKWRASNTKADLPNVIGLKGAQVGVEYNINAVFVNTHGVLPRVRVRMLAAGHHRICILKEILREWFQGEGSP